MRAPQPKSFTVYRWAKATFLGWLCGVLLIIALSSLLDAAGIGHMQFYIGIGMGMGVGCIQWLLLKEHIGMNIAWVVTAVVGMGLPFILLDLFLPDTTYKLPAGVIFGGFVTGIFQCALLKKYYKNAASWVIASIIGWSLAAAVVLLINYTMTIKATGSANLFLALLNLLLILSGGLMLGIITGMFMKNFKQEL